MTAMGKWQASVEHRAVLVIATMAIGLACVARANADPVDLQVVDRETGQPLQLWRHDGHLFVAGAPGDRYRLRVTNHTDGRVLVVMSVDGVNILSGETAGYDQGGYVFGPYQSYELAGWRKSLLEVADFTFTRLSRSYAALTGRPANVGVIGMAVFYEKVVRPPIEEPAPAPPPEDTYRGAADRPDTARRAASESVGEIVVTAEKRGSSRRPAPAAVSGFTSRNRQAVAAEPQDERLGTGHGAREPSAMIIVPFERATPYPQFTQEIAYDTHDNLVAMGVIPAWRYGERQPQPFPLSPPGAGFVPDPPDDR